MNTDGRASFFPQKLPIRDKRTVIEDRVRLTEHFIVTLPALLNKYQVDKEKVTLLLQIPRFFDLELYTSSRYGPVSEFGFKCRSKLITSSIVLEFERIT